MYPLQITLKIKKNVTKGIYIYLSILLLLLHVSCKSKKTSENSLQFPSEAVLSIINDSIRLKKFVVIDVRGRMNYIRGHIQPAVWIASDSLKLKMNSLPKNKQFIVYDSTDQASSKAANFLRTEGIKKVYALEGGLKEWNKNGFPVAVRLVENTAKTLDILGKKITLDEVYNISRKKVKDNGKDYVLIDVRPFQAYKEGHIKNALSIPYVPINQFVINMSEKNFTKNTPLVIYCVGHTCNSGDYAVDVLLRNGYTNVYLFADGIESWMSKGYPLEKD